MGAGSSIDNDNAVAEIDSFRNTSDCWFNIVVTYESTDKYVLNGSAFSSHHTNLALGTNAEEIYRIWGFRWNRTGPQSTEDDSINMSAYCPYEKKQHVLEMISTFGLHHNFSECYSNYTPDKEKVCVNVQIQVKMNGVLAKTGVFGMISTEEFNSHEIHSKHLELLNNTSNINVNKSFWLNRLQDVLPGDKFKDARLAYKNLFERLEKTRVQLLHQDNPQEERAKFAFATKKEVLSYSHALNAGLTSEGADKFLENTTKWRNDANSAALSIISNLLDPMYASVDEQIPSFARDAEPVRDRLRELKNKLVTQFKEEIFSLSEKISTEENAAWSSFQPQTSLFSSVVEKEKSEDYKTNELTESPNSSNNVNGMNGGGGGNNNGAKSRHTRRSLDVLPPAVKDGNKELKQLQLSSNNSTSSNASAAPNRQHRKSLDTPPKLPFLSTELSVHKSPSQDSNVNANANANGNVTPNSSIVAASPIHQIEQVASKALKDIFTRRLAVNRANRTTLQDTTMKIHAINTLDYFVFQEFVKDQIACYFEREYDLLESKLSTNTTKEMEELSHSQAKETADAVSAECKQEELEALDAKQKDAKTRLENKLAEKKREKRLKYEDMKRLTIETMTEKLLAIQEEMTKGVLSEYGIAKFKCARQLLEFIKSQ